MQYHSVAPAKSLLLPQAHVRLAHSSIFPFGIPCAALGLEFHTVGVVWVSGGFNYRPNLYFSLEVSCTATQHCFRYYHRAHNPEFEGEGENNRA